MTITSNAKQVKLNIMTQSQYNSITPSATEFYLITDAEVVTVDNALSSSSENPVQNKVINSALNAKQDTLISGTNIKTINNESLLGSGDITINVSGALEDLSDVTISSPTQGQNLTYDSTLGKWKNTSTSATVAWGGITGTLSDQTDLQNALDAKTTMAAVEAKGYITGITSSDVTTALGYTPYNSTNPSGYITGITSTDVTTALGYTPYNATNPDGFISSASLSSLTDTTISSATGGQVLQYDSSSSKWKNASLSIPAVDQTYDGTSTNAQSGAAIDGALTGGILDLVLDDSIEFSNDATITVPATLDITDSSGMSEAILTVNSAQVLVEGLNDFSSGGSINIGNSELSVENSDGDFFLFCSNNFTNIAARSNDNIGSLQVYPTVLYLSQSTDGGTNYHTASITVDSNDKLNANGGVVATLSDIPSLTNYVTTNTDQNVTGTKTFVGSKKVAFKQSGTNDKLGFTLYTSAGTEKGYLEFNPTNMVDSVPLMTLGNYASAAAGLTHVGFRKYSSISGASGAYNLLAPLISDAKTPFNLTTTYTNFYLPLGITNGTTTLTTAKTGLLDISSFLSDFVTTGTLTSTLANYALSANLATVATTGAYSDLTGTPTVDQTYDGTSTNAQSGVAIEGELANYATSNDLSLVASSIPTDTSDLTNNAGFITGITSSDVTTALGYTPVNPSSLATVATTGAYSDLTGTPSVMTGATSSAAGTSGLTPAPSAGDEGKFLKGDGTWGTPAGLQYAMVVTDYTT